MKRSLAWFHHSESPLARQIRATMLFSIRTTKARASVAFVYCALFACQANPPWLPKTNRPSISMRCHFDHNRIVKDQKRAGLRKPKAVPTCQIDRGHALFESPSRVHRTSGRLTQKPASLSGFRNLRDRPEHCQAAETFSSIGRLLHHPSSNRKRNYIFAGNSDKPPKRLFPFATTCSPRAYRTQPAPLRLLTNRPIANLAMLPKAIATDKYVS